MQVASAAFALFFGFVSCKRFGGLPETCFADFIVFDLAALEEGIDEGRLVAVRTF
jgi:hypothetical protein